MLHEHKFYTISHTYMVDISVCLVYVGFSRVSMLPLLQFGVGGSKASFGPFVDPRVYQTSPDEDDDENSAAGK